MKRCAAWKITVRSFEPMTSARPRALCRSECPSFIHSLGIDNVELPTCWMNGTPASASLAQIGSWDGWPGERPPGARDGIQIAPSPRWRASSMSLSALCGSSSGARATPISRSSPAQNSAIERLCAAAAAWRAVMSGASKILVAQNDENTTWRLNPRRSRAMPRSTPLNAPSASCHLGPRVNLSPRAVSSATVSALCACVPSRERIRSPTSARRISLKSGTCRRIARGVFRSRKSGNSIRWLSAS